MYATLFLLGIRRWSAYRAATFGAAFTNCVFGLIRSAVMIAVVGTAGGALAGYDRATTATYVWLGQALVGPVQLFYWSELAERIRSGKVQAVGAIVGAVMKATKGQADAARVRELVLTTLS